MKKLISATVLSVELLTPNYLLLTVDTGTAVNISAGQFATLEIPGVYLRRPFSIHNAEGSALSFLIKIIGRGTRGLTRLKPGDKISLMYPLGKGFQLTEKPAKSPVPAILVGGGIGIAPLLLLARQLKNKPLVILGGRTKDDIVQLAEFAKYAEVKVTTEDGSLGVKGLVTAELQNISAGAEVYACGPEPMLRALHKLAGEKNFNLQLSLESVMACGVGACLGCVTQTKKAGNVCVCTEGPVFRAEDLPWQI